MTPVTPATVEELLIRIDTTVAALQRDAERDLTLRDADPDRIDAAIAVAHKAIANFIAGVYRALAGVAHAPKGPQ